MKISPNKTAASSPSRPSPPGGRSLIQTVLPGISQSVLEKTRRVTEARLAELRCELADEKQCAHSAEEIVRAMRECEALNPRLYLIAGASAICDDRDEIPEAARMFGAESVRVGMPADPGNLLALARAKNADIIGLPGCARSPKWNGLDLILARLCADIPVTNDDIAAMGVGGLFCEIPERPAPPRPAPRPAEGLRRSAGRRRLPPHGRRKQAAFPLARKPPADLRRGKKHWRNPGRKT